MIRTEEKLNLVIKKNSKLRVNSSIGYQDKEKINVQEIKNENRILSRKVMILKSELQDKKSES